MNWEPVNEHAKALRGQDGSILASVGSLPHPDLGRDRWCAALYRNPRAFVRVEWFDTEQEALAFCESELLRNSEAAVLG